MSDNSPKSYSRLGNKIVDPNAILVVHELDAILRVRCPMQKKWISVRGKRTSCPWCIYLHKIRYTDWGAKIECKYEEGQPVYNFPMRGNNTDEADDCTK